MLSARRRPTNSSIAARRSKISIASSTGDAAHEHAAVLLVRTRPLLEHAERFAHRPARHAEAGGERDLGELGARRQLAGQDHPLELALHQRSRASWSAAARSSGAAQGATASTAAGMGRVDRADRRLSTICKKQLTLFVTRRLDCPRRRVGPAETRHRIGIGCCTRRAGLSVRPFKQPIQRSSHEIEVHSWRCSPPCCWPLRVRRAARRRPQLTVYTALETDQLKAYEAGFNKANPNIEIKWVRDSTGVITAKLLAEKANPQADVVMGVAASSLALLDIAGHAASRTRRSNLDAIMSAVPRQEEPAGLVRHGRLGRDGLLQHGRGAEEEHSQARDLEGPDQAGLQGPDRDAEPGLVGHRLLRRHRLAAALGRRQRQGRRLEVHGRAAREHRAVHALGLASPATWPPPASTWSASRSSTAPTRTRPRARRSTWCSRRKAWAGTSRRSRSTRARRTSTRRRSSPTGRRARTRWLLYAKNFAIVAHAGRRRSRCRTCRPTTRSRLVKNDFTWAAKNRDTILAEWNKRYDAKSEPKK